MLQLFHTKHTLNRTLYIKEEFTSKNTKRSISMKKKNFIFITCLLIFIFITIFSPPIMFAHGLPILGKKSEKSENNFDHLGDGSDFTSRKVYYTTDFDHFYFVNLRFWENLEIEQLQYYVPTDTPEIKKINPFLYSVEQNLKYSYINSFGVSRGNDFWYFDYYARDDKL